MKLRKLLRSYVRVSAGLIRVLLLILVTLALILWISTKAAVARVDDSMLDLGRHLVGLSEAGLGQHDRGTYINGQQLGFRVFTTEQDLSTVLDFYEGWCSNGLGDFATQDEALSIVNESNSVISIEGDRSWRDLTMRSLEEDLGYVACIKHDLPNASSEQLGNRVLAYMDSGNLRDLGQFHYAAVTRVDDVTRVVAVWTEGDFYPGTMFPLEGDAPGFDAAGISRPPSGRRLLSAGEVGHAQTLTLYVDCEQSLDELAVYYRSDFLRHGWRVMLDETEGSDMHFFIVQRDSEMRVVSLTREPGESSSVTIATSS